MVKMAANGEKQQGHRPGVYKQKNKGHKHGKHRTKGEIERENKGKPCSDMKCPSTTGVSCVVIACGCALQTRVEFSYEFRGGNRSEENVKHGYQVFFIHVLVRKARLALITKFLRFPFTYESLKHRTADPLSYC